MEGHQLDSASDIKSKQRKKHIRYRTCNRMLTDAITHELKRLSGFDDCKVSSEYGRENYFMIEERINNEMTYQNEISSSIVLHIPPFDKKLAIGYLYTCSNDNKKIEKSDFLKDNTSKALKIPLWDGSSKSLAEYGYEKRINGSGIYVSRLFIFAKVLYEAAQQLQQIAQKSTGQDAVPSNFFIIPDELKILRKMLNLAPRPHTNIIELKDNMLINYQSNLHHNADQAIRFNVSIERHSMKFDLALNKINIFSRDFLRVLQTIFSKPEMHLNCKTNNHGPCAIRQSWHFRNIIQGYLLGLLLRNINVNSLNIMRKLYFVIITSSTANVIIEIKIKLKSGVFMVYDNCIYPEVINWNKRHKLFVNKSVSMTALETIFQYKYNMRNIKNRHSVISYTKSQLINPTISTCNGYESRTESKDVSSQSNYFSDTEAMYPAAAESSVVTLRGIDSSKFISNPEEAETSEINQGISSQAPVCGNIFNNILDNNHKMYNANYLHSKQWLMKLLPTKPSNDPQGHLKNIMEMFQYNTLKETILDRTSTQMRHLESVTDLFWKQVTSQSFYTLFLKSLGHSIANIFFSTVI